MTTRNVQIRDVTPKYSIRRDLTRLAGTLVVSGCAGFAMITG
jgi:hypothetical protein